MTIEAATYLNDLNIALPAAGDAKNEGDDHLRLLKNVLKTTFPSLSYALSGTLAATGYMRLPGGLILQWVTGSEITGGGSQALTLPLAFPTANDISIAASFQVLIVGGGVASAAVSAKSLTTVTVLITEDSGGNKSVPLAIAIGR